LSLPHCPGLSGSTLAEWYHNLRQWPLALTPFLVQGLYISKGREYHSQSHSWVES
jgi:hypothetical protein